MKMNDEIRIAASREKVFAGLNDVEILKQAIPGCEELQRLSVTELTATVAAKVGPVKAKFKGAVTLSDLNPPESYTITGEGKGGAAGFASGGARISLHEDGDGTILCYEVEAKVGGKLAQIGSRLIDGTAKKLAGEFFEKFGSLLDDQNAPPVLPDAVEPAPVERPAIEDGPPRSRWIWAVVGAGIAAALLIWLGLR